MLFPLIQQEDEHGKESSTKVSDSTSVKDAASTEPGVTASTKMDDAQHSDELSSKTEDHSGAAQEVKSDTHEGSVDTAKEDHAKEDQAAPIHVAPGNDEHEVGGHAGGRGAHGTPDYLSTEELFKHVQDSDEFHFPPTITRLFTKEGDTSSDLYHGHVKLPQFAVIETPLKFKSPYIKPLDFHFTRFMAVELMAAVLVFVVFTAVAQKLKKGGVPKGRLWNLFESMVQFVRRDIGQAIIGKKDGAKFAPFLLTIFFFVLGCNLLGMVPGLGAPTGDFVVTATLALIVFFVVVKAGVEKFGVGGFVKNLVPSMDLPPALKIALVPMIFVIEVVGFLIKHFVLAVRLFANLMAGHLVLAAIVAFIGVTHGEWFGSLVKPASVLGATALSVLEVFVAFLQAYIFTFLTALFISSATHHH